jgi:D-tagatose-1,6-bisphosphate aldolase subunit GatZ/KbaZ
MIAKRQSGIACGVASYCTANAIVIEAIMEQAKRFDDTVLIEATANQVNQYGGYTGMKPADFKNFVYEIADRINFPKTRIILGGDHLGPLVWANENEDEAMAKSIELVKLMVSEGYKKIHLDTSMRLKDDSKTEPLSDEVIAERGARLYKACEETYLELKKKNPSEIRPVYIIGSEVPIPGGAQEEEDSIAVTKPEAVDKTISVYKKQFEKYGFKDAFDNVIGVVVQPGVEFGDDDIFHYDQVKAAALCYNMKKYNGIVLEGHSTDYQSPMELKKMVEDGIAILKVGPALTFGLRKGLFALSMIEKELVPEENRVNFEEVLEEIMLKDPGNWKKHYHGSEKEQALKRKYSFSDRWRYYFAQPEIQVAIDCLIENINSIDIPLGLLYQYMPVQYIKVRDGKLEKKAKKLIMDNVAEIVDSYNFATKYNYMIGEVFVS